MSKPNSLKVRVKQLIKVNGQLLTQGYVRCQQQLLLVPLLAGEGVLLHCKGLQRGIMEIMRGLQVQNQGRSLDANAGACIELRLLSSRLLIPAHTFEHGTSPRYQRSSILDRSCRDMLPASSYGPGTVELCRIG